MKDLIPEGLEKRRDELVRKYGLSRNQAACYLVNYESAYICGHYDGGCIQRNECRRIYEEESR